MFKFMKSKKGFTLVELMIVVVIMAILVAVAVPIFSAVTKNARIKTCEANRREIVSQLNNWAMGSVDAKQHAYTGTTALEFEIDSEGNVDLDEDDAYLPKATFEGLFQDVPTCSLDGGYITVTISKVANAAEGVDQTAAFEVKCDVHTGDDAEGTTRAANNG